MYFLIICGLGFALCIAMLVLRSKGLKNRETELKKIGLTAKDIIKTGRYVYGHPDIDNPVTHTTIISNNGDYKIFPESSIYTVSQELAAIPISAVESITVEDATTIEKKVTALRLLAVGVFAFAFKKKKKQELFYLLIKWNDGKFSHETMFEFEGPNSAQRSNSTRNSLIKAARSQPVTV